MGDKASVDGKDEEIRETVSLKDAKGEGRVPPSAADADMKVEIGEEIKEPNEKTIKTLPVSLAEFVTKTTVVADHGDGIDENIQGTTTASERSEGNNKTVSEEQTKELGTNGVSVMAKVSTKEGVGSNPETTERAKKGDTADEETSKELGHGSKKKLTDFAARDHAQGKSEPNDVTTTATNRTTSTKHLEPTKSNRASLVEFASTHKTSTNKKDENTPDRPSLMEIAKSSTKACAAEKSRATLMDVAVDESPKMRQPSLMDVAKANRPCLVDAIKKREDADHVKLVELSKATSTKQRSTAAKVLHTIARDERAAVENQIEGALYEAKDEVRIAADKRSKSALAKAVHDVQEQEDNNAEEYDEFEYESSTDKINRAVDILVKKTQGNDVAAQEKPHVSVDRDVLRMRQGQGLTHAGPTLKARRDKLSAFQLNQLTETQKRLLFATLAEHKRPVAKHDNQLHMDYINRMAQPIKPKRQKGREQYAKEDDRRHCKFKPRLGRGSAESGDKRSDDEDDDKSNQDFIRRMEAAEKAKNEARRASIRRQRAERIYLAQLDKKECPKCGNPQSYAEVQQKRKQCPNCGVSYKSRLAWGDISDEFFERVELSEEQRHRHLDKITHDTTPAFRVTERRVYDRRRKTIVTVKSKSLTWEDVEYDFLTRVRLDEMNRITNREELEQKFYGCFTYHPSITRLAKRMDYVRFEERMRRDIEQRILRQEQYKITADTRALYRATTT
ncbi:Aste57867_18961 [Aphanomyces stellatus]|uniref:Aste57867_18961 protein n=1 Tax=Aphanomyces stellatus TaxID=120398 RepID=A0A485LBR0_9STRA|nr:hypothetical protein As57867_018897 [Aphanomyces stellatus]VFT95691.1 Aste57867_18961 [Aphanomyces stellatus]